MDNHSLVELAHMLHRVCSTIVDGECWLVEPPRKFPFLNSGERWFGNLVECSAHCIISYISGRLVPISALMVVFLFIRERLTRRIPWSTSITTVLLTVRRGVIMGGSSSSPFVAQLPLYMINFQLHVLGILCVRDMTSRLRLTVTSMDSMYTSFLVPFAPKNEEIILTLGPLGFYLVWTWSHHD